MSEKLAESVNNRVDTMCTQEGMNEQQKEMHASRAAEGKGRIRCAEQIICGIIAAREMIFRVRSVVKEKKECWI